MFVPYAAPPPTPPPAAAAPTRAGSWQWPVAAPVIARPFEPPRSPYGAGHRGVDLGVQPGAPFFAPAPGVVAFAGTVAGRGVVVVVHGALRSTFEPVRPAVAVGTTVSAGQLLGWVQPGHAGCTAAACLHWGVLRARTYLDPLSVVLGTLRLLPHLPGTAAGGRTAPPAPALAPDPAPAARPLSRHRTPRRAAGALIGAAGGGVLALSRRRPRAG